MDPRMTDDQLDRVLAGFLDTRQAEIVAAARGPREAALQAGGIADVRPRFGPRQVSAFTALLLILLLAMLLAAFAGAGPSKAEITRTTEFLHPFRYTLPAEMADGVSFEDFQAVAFTAGVPDEGEPPFGAGQIDAEMTGARGVLIADVAGGNRHRCPMVTGPSRFPLPSDPSDFLDDLRDNGGLRLEEETASTLFGRPALKVHSVASECGTDIHLAMTGDWIRLNMPSWIIVAEVDRTTLMAQIWAGTEAGLEAWTPVAQGLLDSVDLVAAEGGFTAGATLPTGTWTDLLVLPDGRVLALGLVEGGLLAETWDPGTGVFTAGGSLAGAFEDHASAVLSDGRVVVIGGRRGTTPTGSSDAVSVWDPATGEFRATGSLLTPRSGAHAVTLRDDRVVVVGGTGSAGPAVPAELWDPVSGRFSELEIEGTTCRSTFGVIAQSDGRLLVLGRTSTGLCAEVWDVDQATATELGQVSLDRRPDSAWVLSDGRVLVFSRSDDRTEATLWDPTAGESKPAGSIPHLVDGYGTARLTDDRVLVVGGTDPYGFSVASAQLWDPESLSFGPAGQLSVARAGALAVALVDGRVLVAGGESLADDRYGNGITRTLDTTEVFDVN